MSEPPIYAPPEPAGQTDRVPPSAYVLLATNLIPLIGVLLHNWTVFQILLLYWCENVVVGGFNVLRMLVAQPKSEITWAGKLFLIPFFCFHYGMFTLVHGIFVVALFGGNKFGGLSGATLLNAVRGAGLTVPVVALVASHGFSFFHNYLGDGEYQRVFLPQLMFRPYGRIVVLHLTVLLGGFLVVALGAPAAALLLLVGLKTAIDLGAHLKERVKFGAGNSGPGSDVGKTILSPGDS
ncbi:MAG TPA: DUF6498-containing protein [Gemmatimonadales bacterium]|jgi:hypothetical protein